jgi:hypothetical protein
MTCPLSSLLSPDAFSLVTAPLPLHFSICTSCLPASSPLPFPSLPCSILHKPAHIRWPTRFLSPPTMWIWRRSTRIVARRLQIGAHVVGRSSPAARGRAAPTNLSSADSVANPPPHPSHCVDPAAKRPDRAATAADRAGGAGQRRASGGARN